jgi:Polysulphide reductase, NrfD
LPQISQIVATQKVAVRKPYKGTEPKLFYAGIEGDFLQPSRMEPATSHLFAERDPAGNPYTLAQAQNGARPAPGTARVVYDVAHPQPWGMIPVFYLWTKSIAAGLLIVTAIVFGILSPRLVYQSGILAGVISPVAALLFIAITTLLLIADLDRPDRFYYILLKPNWRSWLVRGTWILIVYGILAVIWLAFGLFAGWVPRAVLALSAVAGAATACYSAFLFGQAKGRDLWQSPLPVASAGPGVHGGRRRPDSSDRSHGPSALHRRRRRPQRHSRARRCVDAHRHTRHSDGPERGLSPLIHR